MKSSTNLIYSRVSVYIVQLRNEGKIQGSFEVSKQIIRKARPQSIFREHCPFFFLVKPAYTGKSYIIYREVSSCSTNHRTHIYSHINPLAFKLSQFLTLIQKNICQNLSETNIFANTYQNLYFAFAFIKKHKYLVKLPPC